MEYQPLVQPLPLRSRKRIFWVFLFIFVASLPFLYLHATGYRFEFGRQTNIISTGGMYIASDRTGAEIYIDGDLVRETRAFRRAFYAQNIEPGTHRVHVQKEDHHTWVKELPVSPHLVTEAQAFNLPIMPQVRILSPWQSATGSQVIRTSVLTASSTNDVIATTTLASSTLTMNSEYATLHKLFVPASTTTEESRGGVIRALSGAATTTEDEVEEATTTKEYNGVRLYQDGDDVYAAWIGPREQMPYYYCAEEFPPYSTSTVGILDERPMHVAKEETPIPQLAQTLEYTHPLKTQTIPDDAVCNPIIRMDRRMQDVHGFDFMPGSFDFVILSLEDGIYVSEIDDRSWQNMQPLLLGHNLDFRIVNGSIYVYDGTLIYQVFSKY